MSLVPADAKRFHLGLCHFDARFVFVEIENGFHFKSAPGSRGPDQIHDRLIVDEWLPLPGKTDERKQPVLDLVPLARSRWVMADRDGYSKFVRQCLQV